MSDAIEASALLGRVLAERYRLLKLLGRGGMGLVFEAEQLDLDRRVAIKVLLEDDPRSLERFRQEALATAALQNANVVTILDMIITAPDPPFLVMELLEGEPLSRLIGRQGRLEVRDATQIAAEILSALVVVHRAGIVHRDIKPANIFLAQAHRRRVAKLLDFGIAKVGGHGMKTTTGVSLGTPAYFAPEQILGEPATERTDLHAVGLCLFEMLTGQRPWRGPHVGVDVLRSVPPLVTTIRADVPDALARAIARALSKDVEARHPNAAAMLEAIASTEMPEERSSAPAPAPAPKRSNARIFAAAVASTVLATGGVAATLLLRPGPPSNIPTVPSQPENPIENAPEPTLDGGDASAVAELPVALGADATLDVAASDSTAPAQPRTRCTCVSSMWQLHLCSGAMTPQCECWSENLPLCAQPWVRAREGAPATCKVPRSQVAPGLKTGDACWGYVDMRFGQTYATTKVGGTLTCSVCYGNTSALATPQTSCAGRDAFGHWREGRWEDCVVER